MITPTLDRDYAISVGSAAVSEESLKAEAQISQQSEHWVPLSATDLARMDLQRELDDMYQECLNVNWDDEGALAVPSDAYTEASRLLQQLPSWIGLPDVGPEPNGSIGFEWYARPGWVFVVAITGTQSLEYAGTFGASVTHGTEAFVDSVPTSVLRNLRRLFDK
jgi:hypothetical protein